MSAEVQASQMEQIVPDLPGRYIEHLESVFRVFPEIRRRAGKVYRLVMCRLEILFIMETMWEFILEMVRLCMPVQKLQALRSAIILTDHHFV